MMQIADKVSQNSLKRLQTLETWIENILEDEKSNKKKERDV